VGAAFLVGKVVRGRVRKSGLLTILMHGRVIILKIIGIHTIA